MCHKSTDATMEVWRLEAQFGWYYFKLEGGESGSRKKKKRKGESSDRVIAEWAQESDGKVCSLI